MKAPNHQPLPSPANGSRPLPGGTGHRPVAAGDPPAAGLCAENAARSSRISCAETRRQVAAENGQVGRSTQPKFDRAHCDRGTAPPVPATSSRRVADGLLRTAPALHAFRSATGSRRHGAQRCRVCSPSPFAERGEKVAGGRMRGFLPVGDDVRSLTSNAGCRVRNAEPSQSLLTSAPTSQGNPSPRHLLP